MVNKVLSICIPTYNRSEQLKESLTKLFSDPDFDNEIIEVIVSDNCSTDMTKEVVLNFPQIKYYRNSQNESFKNLTTVLSCATGKYIKLFNDTFSFKPNALKFMLNKIKAHEFENENLMFYPISTINKFKIVKINSLPSFFYECSFHTTWTGTIGFWKVDFDKIENKNKYAALHFPQLEWMYSVIGNNKETIIYFEDLFDVAETNNKGGYNIFKTFITDYLTIVKEQKLSLFYYEVEKYRLCRYFIFQWLVILFINNSHYYTFETKGAFRIILKKYWYEPYVYIMLFIFFVEKLKKNF